MRVPDVPRIKAYRVYSLYRRGVRAVEICNLLFPEHRRLTNEKKRAFIWNVLQYNGLGLNKEERGERSRMYARPKKPKSSRQPKSKWVMK